MSILPRDGSAVALVVHGSDLVGPTAAHFDTVWHDAIPIVMDGPATASEVSDARVRQVGQ